jgi:polysaccharide biosynthesis PFTS motif protein
VFASQLEDLIRQEQDIFIIMKEKKPRWFHKIADPVLGKRLEILYDSLAKHPRVLFCPASADTSTIISVSDIVVSLPFTSTTFEALSVDRPAIWHDPAGLYRDTIYAHAGVTTHPYKELHAHVARLHKDSSSWENPIPKGSQLLDPYRDGQAIDRFRQLLLQHS